MVMVVGFAGMLMRYDAARALFGFAIFAIRKRKSPSLAICHHIRSPRVVRTWSTVEFPRFLWTQNLYTAYICIKKTTYTHSIYNQRFLCYTSLF